MQVTAATLLSGLINGVLFGSLLGVIAIGLTLIWGVMKVVNLAHGHAVVFGAMAAAFMVTAMGLSPIHALVLAGLVGVPLGAALYYISLHMIIGRIDTITLREEMATLMTTFGAGLVIYGSHFVIHQFIPPEYSTEPSIYWAPGSRQLYGVWRCSGEDQDPRGSTLTRSYGRCPHAPNQDQARALY